jgi:hypothetical protein
MTDITRAIAAATSVAASLDLPANDAVVLHNSNRLALRLTPCDVLARSPRCDMRLHSLKSSSLNGSPRLDARRASWPLGWTHLCTRAMASE